MKADRYVWVVVSLLFLVVGSHLLFDSIRHAGPYADEYVLLGATLAALGLAALVMALENYRQIRAMAKHMRRGAHFSKRSRATGTEDKF